MNRDDVARVLIERFNPEVLDPRYIAEMKRRHIHEAPIVDRSAYVYEDTSIRAVTYGELADFLIEKGWTAP